MEVRVLSMLTKGKKTKKTTKKLKVEGYWVDPKGPIYECYSDGTRKRIAPLKLGKRNYL